MATTASEPFGDDIDEVTSRIEGISGFAAQLEAEHDRTLDSIKTMETDVKKRSEELVEKLEVLKLVVRRQTHDVLQQLESLKSYVEEELKSRIDTLQLAVSEMESLRTSSLELRSKGSPSDVTQAANDVHERAKQLLETYVIPSEYHAPSYKFTPVNVDELLKDDQNFVGHVVEVTASGNIKSYCRDVLDVCYPLSSDRQRLSYDVCLEVRGEIIITVLYWIVY